MRCWEAWFGRFIHSSDLHWANSIGKACQWSHGMTDHSFLLFSHSRYDKESWFQKFNLFILLFYTRLDQNPTPHRPPRAARPDGLSPWFQIFWCLLFCLFVCFQALPEDLKTKLSLDEDLVSSPKEALSRASADRIAMRHKHLKRFGLLIYSFFFFFLLFFSSVRIRSFEYIISKAKKPNSG